MKSCAVFGIDPLPRFAEIPASHSDLLQRPLVATLATVLPDGQPQTQPVWFNFDLPYVLINTMRGFRKERNLRADPRATLLVIDPSNSSRWLEVRGLVELIDQGAQAHLDYLAHIYARVDRFFGGCVPAEFEGHEIPVIGRISPTRVVDEHSADRLPTVKATPVATRRPVGAAAPLPESHLDLLRRPLIGVLSTLMPDGHPQTQPVWFAFDEHGLSINTTRERQKGRNMTRDPRATLLIIDPDDANRWVEVRADVEVGERGAIDHVDRLTRAYTPWPQYYGHIRPLERRQQETRILCRLIPRHVVCDAIHRSPTGLPARRDAQG